MQACLLLKNAIRLINDGNLIDQVILHPFGCSVPPDIIQSILNMDRAGKTIQTDAIPVPELERKVIRRGTDFQYHRICGRTMYRAGRNQKMIMPLCRKVIDIPICRERDFSSRCSFQIFSHLFPINSLFQSEIYACRFLCVKNVIAFILCICHAEMRTDIFCQRMYLQRKILSSDRIKKVESNREFRAETAIVLHAEKLDRLIKDQIHRRNLDPDIVKTEIEAVLFGNTVKAPCIVRFILRQSTDLFHPLAAPYTGIKIRYKSERLPGNLSEAFAKSFSGHHFQMSFLIGVQEPVYLFKDLHFTFVRNAPLNEISSLYFPEGILVVIGLLKIRHPSAVTQLYLPPGQVAIDQRVGRMDQSGSNPVDTYPPVLRNPALYTLYGFTVNKIFHSAVEHDASDSVIGQMRCHLLRELFSVRKDILAVDKDVRIVAFADKIPDFIGYSRIALHCKNVIFFLPQAGKIILYRIFRVYFAVKILYDSFGFFIVMSGHHFHLSQS